MRTHALALLPVVAASADGAETCRWVDEHDVTTYGGKPLPGRAGRWVDVKPAGTVESPKIPLAWAYEGAVALPTRGPTLGEAPAAPAASVHAPGGMAFETYTCLSVGMSEGEVLLRAGEPDHVSVESGRPVFVKSVHYYPTASNPFLTIVTLRGGVAGTFERNRRTD